jgi:SAM-dependent methyltransferase
MAGSYSNSFPEEEQHSLPPVYNFNAEDKNENTHLLLQHRYLSQCMGGALPASLDISRVKRVLDANCSAGGWVYELAWNHPSMHITGIDGRPEYVQKGEKFVHPLGNARVVQQDIHQLSDEVLPLASFDLVHARFLVGILHPQAYPDVLASLASRCRPGGVFVWDELEYPTTNSAACQQLIGLVQDGLQATGRAFSPGHALGITPMMRSWIQEAGCKVKLDTVYAIELSSDTKGRDAFVWQMWRLCKQIRPLLLEAGMTTEASFEKLFFQAQRDIFEESFCGLFYVRTMAGTKQ